MRLTVVSSCFCVRMSTFDDEICSQQTARTLGRDSQCGDCQTKSTGRSFGRFAPVRKAETRCGSMARSDGKSAFKVGARRWHSRPDRQPTPRTKGQLKKRIFFVGFTIGSQRFGWCESSVQ